MDNVEKLARVVLQIFHERKDGMFIGALTGEPISYERLAPVNMAILKDATQKVLDAGYLPVEPVQEISLDKVKTMSHFGVVRDWVITMKDGKKVELSAGVVEQILEHENKERGYVSKSDYEPVMLEVLGDKEILKAYKEVTYRGGLTGEAWRAISQATITHNESKGQLYRRK